MRPLKLHLSGLRSFRTEREIDFSELSLVAIIGETGAGKSSLLEALTFALYGGSTWDARGGGELISDDARTMTVSLDFGAEGDEWRVTRQVSRTATRPARHELVCTSDPTLPRVDGAREVRRRVTELVGLDHEGFQSCVLLPQGRFEQLLKASPTARSGVLKGILRLNELTDLREDAARALGELVEPRITLERARARLLEDPAAARAEAETDLDALRPRRERLEGARAELAELTEAYRMAQTQASRLETEADALVADIDHRVTALGNLVTLEEGLNERGAEVDRAVSQARTGVELAQATVDADESVGRSASALRTAAQQVAEAARQQAAIARDETDVARTADVIKTGEQAAERRAEAIAELVTRQEAARQTSATSDSDAQAARRIADDAASTFVALKAARTELDSKRAARDETADAQRKTDADRETAEHELVRLEGLVREAADRHAEAVRSSAAAHAAGDCQPGDPCPVCRRTLPDGFTAPDAPDLDQATRALTAARTADRDQTTAVAEARARANAAASAANTAQTQFATAQASFDTVDEAVRAAIGDVEPEAALRTHVARAEELERAAKTAADALIAVTAELDKLRSDDRAGEAALDAKREAMTQQRDALDGRKAAQQSRLSEVAAHLPSDGLPDVEELMAIARRVAAAAEEAESHVKALNSARSKLANAEQGERAFTRERQDSLLRPLAADHGQLVQIAGRLEGDSRPATATALTTAVELKLWAEGLRDALMDAARNRREQAQSFRDAAEQTRKRGRDVVATLNLTSSAELENAIVAARAQEQNASELRERAIREAPSAQDLDGHLAQVQATVAALTDLRELLADGKFVRYAVEQRQRALLALASGVLDEITGGRFGFTGDFQIVDRTSGQARSPDTLSGGETFMASLSLALGLVELTVRSGGKLDALFLDEGFGSLDPNALDEALDALERRARAGKLIGVISHVPEVAERIEEVLQVVRSSTGSDVRRLGGAERAQLAAEAVATRAVA